MTVIFLPGPSHRNTFRHIEPKWTCSQARFTLVPNRTANAFAVHWTGRVKITTVPNQTEPNRTGTGQNHALSFYNVSVAWMWVLHVSGWRSKLISSSIAWYHAHHLQRCRLLFSGRILVDIPCCVCRDNSSGKHYGIYACDGWVFAKFDSTLYNKYGYVTNLSVIRIGATGRPASCGQLVYSEPAAPYPSLPSPL